jgi:hypothetical protein
MFLIGFNFNVFIVFSSEMFIVFDLIFRVYMFHCVPHNVNHWIFYKRHVFHSIFHLETTNFAISEVPSVVGRSPEDLEDLWVLCKRLEFAIEAPNGPVEIVDFPIEIVVIFHS